MLNSLFSTVPVPVLNLQHQRKDRTNSLRWSDHGREGGGGGGEGGEESRAADWKFDVCERDSGFAFSLAAMARSQNFGSVKDASNDSGVSCGLIASCFPGLPLAVRPCPLPAKLCQRRVRRT